MRRSSYVFIVVALLGIASVAVYVGGGNIRRSVATPRSIPERTLQVRPYLVSVVAARGIVEIQRTAETRWSPLALSAVLEQGDIVRTGNDGYATLRVPDGLILEMRPSSLLEVEPPGMAPKFLTQ